MIKKVLITILLVVAVTITATFIYWTQQPAYALSKIVAAARQGDTASLEKYVNIEGVANSLVEEALRISQEKFPTVGVLEERSPRTKDFFKKMAMAFLRDVLNSKTPGFKFKEMSYTTYLLLQTKLFVDSFQQEVVAQSEDVVDVAYNLEALFQQKYNAVFTYKKIGTEWTLFEIKALERR